MTAMDYRQYDNALGRFNSVDALAELMPGITPYHFGFNNPVYWSDPTGLSPTSSDDPDPIELDPYAVWVVGKPKNSDRSYSAGLEMFELPKLEVGDFPEFSSGGGKDNLGEPKKKQVDPQSPEEQRKYQQDIRNLNDTFGPIIKGMIEIRTFFAGIPKVKVKGLTALSKADKFSELQFAEIYGVRSYATLKALLKNTGLQAHHLIEQRFASILGVNAGSMKSIAVTAEEHQIFTNAWRAQIGYKGSKATVTTTNATRQQIYEAAKVIYKDYPVILKTLGL